MRSWKGYQSVWMWSTSSWPQIAAFSCWPSWASQICCSPANYSALELTSSPPSQKCSSVLGRLLADAKADAALLAPISTGKEASIHPSRTGRSHLGLGRTLRPRYRRRVASLASEALCHHRPQTDFQKWSVQFWITCGFRTLISLAIRASDQKSCDPGLYWHLSTSYLVTEGAINSCQKLSRIAVATLRG